MKNNVLNCTLVLCTICMLLYSCQKKAEVDTETQTAVDNTIAETAFTQVFPTVNGITIQEDGVRATNSSCATYKVTGDTANFPANGPVIITITFDSTAGCTDADGRFKKGQLVVEYTEKWSVPGSTIRINLDDYYVDNINYSGIVTVTNNGDHSFTSKVIDGKCVAPDWLIEYASVSTVEQIAGEATLNTEDDVFRFTGSSNGVNRKGRKFTTKIATPLIKRTTCNWIESGVLEITPDELASRTVNFGNGACDNDAVLTINGNKYDIKLK